MDNFTIIIPAHNEEKTVAGVVRASIGTTAREILVINDGSRDATADTAREASGGDARVRVINHPKNRGYGEALKTGIRTATTDILVFFDGDIRNAEASKIQALALPILEKKYDYVLGVFGNAGRITEFLVRPMLSVFLPGLAHFKQPLSGLFASRKKFLYPENMIAGYGISGVHIDAYLTGARMTETDIGEIVHDHRTDEEKKEQAMQECQILVRQLEDKGILNIHETSKTTERGYSRYPNRYTLRNSNVSA